MLLHCLLSRSSLACNKTVTVTCGDPGEFQQRVVGRWWRVVCHFLRFVSHFLLFLQESTSFASFLCLRSSFLWLSLMAWALHFQQRRAPAHLYHGLSAVVHCACIKTKSCSSILLHLNLMYVFFCSDSIAQSCSSSMRFLGRRDHASFCA